MNTPADQLFDELAADVADALDRVGGEIVEAKREDLSTPVGVTTGPRGGKVYERSKPGEFPRMESKTLRDELTNEPVQRDGLAMTLKITDPANYAKPLENIDRIVTSDIPDRFAGRVADAVAQAITGAEK